MNVIRGSLPDEPPSRISDIEGTRNKFEFSRDSVEFFGRFSLRHRALAFRYLDNGIIPSHR